MMRTHTIIDNFIKQYGSFIALENGSKQNYGVLSPNNAHSNTFLQKQMSHAGISVGGDFILLLSAKTTDVMKGCKLLIADKWFYVKAINYFYLHNEPLYQWAMLSPIHYEEVVK